VDPARDELLGLEKERGLLNMALRQHGFNLIEVMVTLTVLAIMISLGVPGFVEWLQSQRVRASAEAITNGMQVARGEAIRRNLPVVLGLEPPTTAWTVCQATVSPCDSTTAAGNMIQNKSGAESSGDAKIAPTPAGAILVTFSPLGSVVSNFDGSASLKQVDVFYSDPALCSAAGGTMRCLRVVVTPGGNARMCDPTPSIVAPDPRACP
jgi:type IV fimbrial biogenesis protein FimT